MKEITEAIDAWTSAQYGYSKQLWGYCELMTKTDQVMPVTINGRKQVSLHDSYEIITWMRLTGKALRNEIEGNNWAFGLNQGIVQSATLRFILAHKVSIGEDFIVTFLSDFPRLFTVDGYQIVSVDKAAITIDPDHEAVYRTELGETVYEKHRFDWNIYALSINVEFIPCEVSSV